MNNITRQLGRSFVVISATSALVIGATYALIQTNPVTVDASTMSTQTADLNIWNGTAFGTHAPGVHINDLVPGTGATRKVAFHNLSNMNLKLSARLASVPPIVLTGFAHTNDFNKIFVTITDDNNPTDVTNTTFAALLADEVPVVGQLDAGATGNVTSGGEGTYSVKFDFDPTALVGTAAAVTAFDLQFTGTQIAPPSPSPTP